jgi:DNA polymerase/3'-5' exonuclease PolX
MSIGTKIPHADALAIARDVVTDLEPLCSRIKVAGSLRRMRPHVSDIEIVAEPHCTADLFGAQLPQVEPIRRMAESWGVIVKGGEKYIQVHTAMSGMKIDLFLVTPPADYFVILAIRTGPANLGQLAVTRMHDFGRRCEAGRIIDKRTGEQLLCMEEADFFRAAGLPCLPPRQRESREAMRPLQVAQ